MTGSHTRRAGQLAVLVLAGIVGLLSAAVAGAHPEDEFCVPGKPGIDPALCRAIAALDPEEIGKPGTVLQPLTDEAGNVRGFWSTFSLYIGIGVGHILPGGLDHILFVLALCLASTRLRALLLQVSAFTVAHTATLGLAAAGVIAPPASVVEPLIAATIAFVAIENILFADINRWRAIVVFGFGLVHGLGFAGFFGELGLPPNQFWSALLGFNVGVEIGQLSVIAAAATLLFMLRRRAGDEAADDGHYRHWLVQPASAVIAVVGLWWAIQRTFFG
jgi:hypothetical protein